MNSTAKNQPVGFHTEDGSHMLDMSVMASLSAVGFAIAILISDEPLTLGRAVTFFSVWLFVVLVYGTYTRTESAIATMVSRWPSACTALALWLVAPALFPNSFPPSEGGTEGCLTIAGCPVVYAREEIVVYSASLAVVAAIGWGVVSCVSEAQKRR